jgi:hypothetical protein
MTATQEAKERLRAGLDQHVALESVSASVKCADLSLILASHDALAEALRPLDECAMIEPDSGPLPDDHGARYFITYGEIRRARARLKEAGQ